MFLIDWLKVGSEWHRGEKERILFPVRDAVKPQEGALNTELLALLALNKNYDDKMTETAGSRLTEVIVPLTLWPPGGVAD